MALLHRRQLLTCSSAAPFYGLWSLECAGPVHVQHRRGEASEGQIGHSGLLLEPHPYRPVAALGDVLIHALRCQPFAKSLVMVECAVVRGYSVLRYYYDDVVHHPELMLAEVQAVLSGFKPAWASRSAGYWQPGA